MPFPSAVAALIAFVFVGVLAAPVASARLPPGSGAVRMASATAATTNAAADAPKSRVTGDLTDIWWPNNEPGWGIQFVHNADYVFATLYVYDAAGKATFFVGSLQNTPVGSNLWTGPLSATTGPYFGAAFNPAAVVETVVGSMTFEVDTRCWCEGALTYNVGAVQVAKFIDRQPLKLENFSGYYHGEFITYEPTGTCVFDEYPDDRTFVSINQTGTAATVLLTGLRRTQPAPTCGIFATYSQTGRLGRFEGTLACPTGQVGQLRLGEIVSGPNTMTGTWRLEWGSGCSLQGEFVLIH